MTLDPDSLGLAFVLVTAALGVLLLFSWVLNRKVRSLAWWGSAFCLVALGMSGVSLDRPPSTAFPLITANVLVVLGYGALYTGCRVFGGHRPTYPAALAGAVLWLICWPFVSEWLAARVMLIGLIVGGYTSLAAWTLWRQVALGISSAALAVALLVGSAAFHLLRGLLGLWPIGVYWIDVFATRWSNEQAVVFLVYVPVLAFVLLSMAKERSEAENRLVTQHLKDSEARYRALVTASASMFWRIAPDGSVIEALGWEDISGQQLEEFKGAGWLRMVHPDDLARTLDNFHQRMASGKPGGSEFRAKRRDGEYRWVFARSVPLKDSDGYVREWLGTLTDIHDHKVAQEELAKSEERHQLAARATNDALWDWDFERDETYWNQAVETLFGYRSDQVTVGADWWKERLHPDDRGRVLTSIQAVIDGTDSHWAAEYRFRRADGSYAEVFDRGYMMRDPEGHPRRMVGAMLDQSTRKAAEATLRLRDQSLAAIGQGVLITDAQAPDNPIIYANPAFEAITGYTAAEVLGRNCRFLQGQKSDPAVVAAIRSALSDGEPIQATLMNYRKDGTPFMNDLTIAPVHGPDGTLTHFVGIQSDVSERIRLEDQLRQSQKMEAIGQLSGGIAHDFNNLLTIIQGNAELLLEDPTDAELTASLSQMILEAAERGADLTQQLLSFGRRQTLNPERLQLRDVVRGMLPLLRRTIGEHIALQTEFAEGAPSALTDRTLLESALLNLVVNARDAMASGGTLLIQTGARVAAAGDGSLPQGQPVVFVTVSDTGVGMSREVLARAFEPFFTTKGVGKGSGLGLSMVYGFAQQSGGHVSIESAEGHGTSVSLLLLAAEPSAAAVPPRALSIEKRGDEKVLVVEDEPQVRQFVSSQLAALGYEVSSASKGDEALTLLRSKDDFQLLFTDVVLAGGMSGIELVRNAKAISPELKVLLTSGYSEEVFEHHGRPDDAVPLLHKPYKRAALASMIRSVLDAPP